MRLGLRRRRLSAGVDHGLSPLVFSLFAVGLGVVAGLGAWVFRALIALVHDAAFLGTLSIRYDANAHTPDSPWGLGVALVPVLGAMVVVFLVTRFAPEAKGHGVPEVMDAIYYKKGQIRGVVAAIKAVASAISIGTGGSVGREGPIVQIGAAVGSWSAGVFGASRWQRATLVAAGGGAGIAATFNTPIGGILFAVEVLMHEVSVRTLVPVALAATTATYVGRALFGNVPAFPLPPIEASERLTSLPAFALLGVATALASILFIRSLYGAEDLFERWIPKHPYLRHGLGMTGVGVLLVAMHEWGGHYYVGGVGYATIVDVLTAPPSLALLGALFFGKLLATSSTLGSGGSGGIFSPALFLGATLGAAFGTVAAPVVHEHPAVFVLAGMAGMVSGTTGAVLTAMVMLFEMTLDYAVVLPMALTATVAYGVRRALHPESVYTMKLTRRGHVMPAALQANAHLVHHVSDIALPAVAVLGVDVAPSALDLGSHPESPDHFVLVDEDRIAGVLSREWARAHPERLAAVHRLGDLICPEPIVIAPDATVFDLLAHLQRGRVDVAVVAETSGGTPPKVVGVITKAHVAEALAEGMEIFQD
ncbi:MAG: chloride channel protein [Myxococcales bacterium]|nr:chloride channel protein [Myxococcales bacterium]